jgi:hypothetical protein
LETILKKRVLIMKKTFVLITSVLVSMFFANGVFAQSEELIRVYRWYNPEDKNYVTVAEGEYQEGQMLNWGWKDKTLLFFAYRTPGPERVAVMGWFNPVSKDYVSVAEDEFSDDQMLKMGYKDKKVQFYGLTRRGPNTMPVYRWKIEKNADWVTIPEEGNTDLYIKKGYKRKSFQYFGIPRNVDAPVYNQL